MDRRNFLAISSVAALGPFMSFMGSWMKPRFSLRVQMNNISSVDAASCSVCVLDRRASQENREHWINFVQHSLGLERPDSWIAWEKADIDEVRPGIFCKKIHYEATLYREASTHTSYYVKVRPGEYLELHCYEGETDLLEHSLFLQEECKKWNHKHHEEEEHWGSFSEFSISLDSS